MQRYFSVYIGKDFFYDSCKIDPKLDMLQRFQHVLKFFNINILLTAVSLCKISELQFAGFVRGLENLECACILFSEFKALKVLEFPKLAFILILACINYGINDVSKHVNIASKCLNIMWSWSLVTQASYEFARGSFCVFYR